MIDFQNVSKSFGGQDVLTAVSFRINDGERAGIVGPNGAGKSTIFKLITGEIEQDRGEIILPRAVKIGYLRQQLNPHAVDTTLLEYAEDAMPELEHMQREIDEIAHRLHALDGAGQQRDLKRLGELQGAFEHAGGYDLQHRAEAALCGLGFAADALGRPFREFSGGWQMRAELARTLVARPDILLLDEPSNYLDLPAVEWLKDHLAAYKGTLVLISHDRYLLTALTSITFEVNGARVTRYPGNCEYYLEERVRRYEQLSAEKENADRRRAQLERFIERFRAKNTKASQAQSRMKMLEKMEEITLPEPLRFTGRIRVAKPPHCGVEVMRLEDAGVSYGGGVWVLRHVDLSIARGEKIALVGLNGMGKTTLLRVLAGILPLSEGTRMPGHHVALGYQAQEFAENLPPDQTAYQIVKAARPTLTDREVRSTLGSFGFSGDSVDKVCDVLSGGEKIRLAFARILVNPPNFLLLDEPTTHLDMAACEALQNALADYEGTLVIVSHDVEFVRNVATSIIAMTPPGITRYAGNYDYYKEKSAAMALAALSRQEAPRKETPAAGKKASRHERAEKVRQTAAQRRPLQQKMAAAEKRLDFLHADQAAVLETLSARAAGTDFAQLNQRLAALQKDIAETERAWEDAAEKLQELA